MSPTANRIEHNGLHAAYTILPFSEQVEVIWTTSHGPALDFESQMALAYANSSQGSLEKALLWAQKAPDTSPEQALEKYALSAWILSQLPERLAAIHTLRRGLIQGPESALPRTQALIQFTLMRLEPSLLALDALLALYEARNLGDYLSYQIQMSAFQHTLEASNRAPYLRRAMYHASRAGAWVTYFETGLKLIIYYLDKQQYGRGLSESSNLRAQAKEQGYHGYTSHFSTLELLISTQLWSGERIQSYLQQKLTGHSGNSALELATQSLLLIDALVGENCQPEALSLALLCVAHWRLNQNPWLSNVFQSRAQMLRDGAGMQSQSLIAKTQIKLEGCTTR